MPRKNKPAIDIDKLTGAIYDWRETDNFVSSLRRPVFGACAGPIRGSGKGKYSPLYKALLKERGSWINDFQTIGDCVGHGYARGTALLAAAEISAGEREVWKGDVASEAIYAASRVEIGGGRLGNGDGSIGAWAARAVTEYGTLIRGKYGNIDLTTYDGRRAKRWGNRGVGLPDSLESVSKEHPVRTVSLCTSFEDARDSIHNGYPVVVCSMQGFNSRRDRDGYAKASGQWAHCMLFVGAEDRRGKRSGLLCDNSSWGENWIDGPKKEDDQPGGAFWVDADVADRMLRRDPDSYSLSGYEGFPSQDFSVLDIWR
jgi:hypothetical protein